jgi:hypothetical protein
MIEPTHPTEFTFAQLVRLRYLAARDAVDHPTPAAENLKRKLTEYVTQVRGTPMPEVVAMRTA